MNVNFIVTCYDKENYWPYLKSILDGFKVIKPHVCISYNGAQENFGSVKIENLGHQLGEFSLIKAGYNHLKNNGINKWIKLSIDSWPCDEQVLIDTFNQMEQFGSAYAGNFWNTKYQLSTDVFFADTTHVNLFDSFQIVDEHLKLIQAGAIVLENVLYRAVAEVTQPLILWDREPVHPNNRDVCERLKLTMSHDLEVNIKNAERWKKSESPLNFILSVYQTAPNDIQPFLGKLKEVSEGLKSVSVLGDNYCIPTSVFLVNGCKTTGYDYTFHSNVELSSRLSDKFEFIIDDLNEIRIEKSDLLYIDANKCSEVSKILENNADNVYRYIVVHYTFSGKDEIFHAFREALPYFKRENKWHRPVAMFENNSQLLIFERKYE